MLYFLYSHFYIEKAKHLCYNKNSFKAKLRFSFKNRIYTNITSPLDVSTLIALCYIASGNPALLSFAVLGEISISSSPIKAEDLTILFQICLDSVAKKVLPSITSAANLGVVPPKLMGNLSIIFYQSPEDAVFKTLGVE